MVYFRLKKMHTSSSMSLLPYESDHRIWCDLGNYTKPSPIFPLSQINQGKKGERESSKLIKAIIINSHSDRLDF